jgi:hypothetical protein
MIKTQIPMRAGGGYRIKLLEDVVMDIMNYKTTN